MLVTVCAPNVVTDISGANDCSLANSRLTRREFKTATLTAPHLSRLTGQEDFASHSLKHFFDYDQSLLN
jgi:hypothetical protein